MALVTEPTKTRWATLEPLRVQATDGSTLVPMPDRSVLATGKRPDRERMTVVAKSPIGGVTAVRLELLTDASLPHRGPGRSYHGHAIVTEFKLSASSPKGVVASPVTVTGARADYHEGDSTPERAIDGNQGTGWSIGGWAGAPHVAVFEIGEVPPVAAIKEGSELTFVLDQQFGQGATLGRFRLSVTSDRMPLPDERRGVVLRPFAAKKVARRRMLFDDEADILSKFDVGRAAARVESGDRFAGAISLAATKEATGAARLPGVQIPIREKPLPGEFRYVRFVWKKRGGGGIALAFATDGAWEVDGRPARYASGADGVFLLDGSRRVHDGCPEEWIVVTRDAFADFGPVIVTGFALNPIGGEAALVDQIQFARTLDEFDGAK
jgi:hypothetical protein